MNNTFRVLGALVCLAAISVLPSTSLAQEDEAPSLYERLGGLMPISVVVSDFIDAMVVDEELNKNPLIDEARKRIPAPYLKYHVTAMVCQATGGPCEYGGRGMEESHGHLQITEVNWDRMVTILKDVMTKHGVPDAEQGEIVAIVESTKGDIVVGGEGSR